MPTYDDFDAVYEYLDLSGKRISTLEIKEILDDLVDDTMIKHINLSDNITLTDAANPDVMNSLFDSLVRALEQNDCLVALDWASNHLGNFSPHPANQHITEYIAVLAGAICKSNIRRIDLSHNMLTGKSFRKFSGLSEFVRACIPNKFEVFRFRKNGINSLGLALFSGALGLSSSLQELDLSDNHVGRDAYGRNSCEGMSSFCVNLSQTHSLKKLLLAGNFLHDEEIVELCSAVTRMPNLALLDISRNEFRAMGMEAVKNALISHASFYKIREGLKELDISNNPLSEGGLEHVMQMVQRNDSLTTLNVSNCKFNVRGIEKFANALQSNSKIRKFHVHDNGIDKELFDLITAETDANALLISIRTNPQSIDANTLPKEVYMALSRKLRFLPSPVLSLLHENASFTEPLSAMKESLFLLEPPSRREILGVVVDQSSNMRQRLNASSRIVATIDAEIKIFRSTLRWYRRLKMQQRLLKASNELYRLKSQQMSSTL